MAHTNEKPGAGGTGPRNDAFAGGRNGAYYNGSGRFDQRSTTEELERVRSALAFIDPRDHDSWLKIGMALKAEFGEDAWPVFDEWSQQAENYNPRPNRKRWDSFWNGGGITIATLYGMARDNGWRDDGTYRVPDPEEMAARARKRAEEEAETRAARQAGAAEAAKKSVAIWSMASVAAADNPYLQRKGVPPTETLREIDARKVVAVLGYAPSAAGEQLGGRLLVAPIKVGGAVSSVQLIDGHPRKHFLAGGAIANGYWAAQALADGDGTGLAVLIGEGVATVLSARRAVPGALGISAMSNGNIPSVARQMRERYPDADIVVLADLDKKTGEPDKHAVSAAAEAGGRLAVPRFADGPANDRKDFNDLARVHGVDVVRQAIEAATMPSASQTEGAGPAGGDAGAKSRRTTTVTLVRADTVRPEPVNWLWGGHLARKKVHILAGKPAAGKTTLAIAMAAIVTTGGTWPDGTQCQPGNVVVWSGEDDPSDTLVPRLIAAGADLERVHFVGNALEDGEPVPFDPAKHLASLAETLSGLADVALLIVDPVVSAVAGDSYKNAEVRRALQPLADLAASSDCAVIGITHFTKGTGGRDPVERLTGSLAFGAVARVVLLAAKVEDDAEETEAGTKPRRLMMRAKSNIGPDGGGFAYDLEQRELHAHDGIITSAVTWGVALHGSARDLLADAESIEGSDGDSIAEAMSWLRDQLADGPVDQTTIKTKAKTAGHSWATVRRAKTRLAVKSRKKGMADGWAWELPRRCSENSEDAPSKTDGAFEEFEHLRAWDNDGDEVEGTI